MIVFRRIIPFICALLLAAAYEVYVFLPEAWYICLTVIIVTVIFSSWFLQKERRLSTVVGFTVGPLFINAGAVALLTVMQSDWISQLLIVTTTLGTAIFYEHLFTFSFLPDRYKPHALEAISLPLNLLTVFLFATAGSAMWVFMHTPTGYLTLGFFVLTLFLSWQFFWISKVPMTRARWGVLFSAVLATQLFWVMTLLPLSFFIVGILVVALFYLTLNITRFSTLDSLGSNVVKRTVVLVALAVISVLVTAQWV